MFKTSFSKYLTAFIVITFVSFLILSGIITSIIRDYVNEDVEEKLELSGRVIVDHLVESEVEDLETAVKFGSLPSIVDPVVNLDTQVDIVITGVDGRIFLSTAVPEAIRSDGVKESVVSGELGSVDLSSFNTVADQDGYGHLEHRGTLDGLLKENSIVHAEQVITAGELRGYVMTLVSTANEDALTSVTRQTVINSSVWVMLAAVIAAYFITERIVHPLRTMTGAAKKFGKGDFSIRVPVYGKDEVSELAVAFNNMADSLDSLEKMRNSFLANVSHELRTPMTTIAGFIDGINSGAIPPEKHEYYLGVISSEVHRLSRLVSQILDVSKLESGERKFNYTDFDVAEMARLVLISFEQKIEDKKLDVAFDAEDDMIVSADKDAIHQVIYNLCHNAIKFAKEGGVFSITVSRIANKKISVSVYDEGQSIATEEMKLVFDRFYKTDKSRSLDKSGVGLGLYISKTIIDAHEESIWIDPEAKDGTRFTFTLKEGTPKRKQPYKEAD